MQSSYLAFALGDAIVDVRRFQNHRVRLECVGGEREKKRTNKHEMKLREQKEEKSSRRGLVKRASPERRDSTNKSIDKRRRADSDEMPVTSPVFWHGSQSDSATDSIPSWTKRTTPK